MAWGRMPLRVRGSLSRKDWKEREERYGEKKTKDNSENEKGLSACRQLIEAKHSKVNHTGGYR